MIRPASLAILFAVCSLMTASAQSEDKLHDAIKPVPRQGGWMKRHESFNARVA